MWQMAMKVMALQLPKRKEDKCYRCPSFERGGEVKLQANKSNAFLAPLLQLPPSPFSCLPFHPCHSEQGAEDAARADGGK